MPGASNQNPLCGTDWGRLLKDELEKQYWGNLIGFVRDERSRGPVYPPANEVFRAMQSTWCNETKVVIVGQDPYYRPGEAHGLCFSVPCGVTSPASLKSIHRELETDQLEVKRPDHGSLEPWAHRGVLLLNTTLTVAHGKPGSHFGEGWEDFTDEVIRVVAERNPVFLLWGKHAHRKEQLIAEISGSTGMIIKSSHPAPPACYRPCGDNPAFLGSGPFSKANKLLRGSGRVGINWDLTP